MNHPYSLSWSFILTVLLVALVSKSLHNRWRRRPLPPGPPSLPIIGNILQLDATEPLKSVTRLAASYGSIMTLNLGWVTTVVISSSALAKKALVQNPERFSTPFKLDALYAHQHDVHSLSFLPASSPLWRALRRIWAGHLITGRRLDSMGPVRAERVSELLGLLRSMAAQGAVVDVGPVVRHAFFTLMLATNFSEDLAQRPALIRAREIEEAMAAIVELTKKPNVVDCFPALHALDPQHIRQRLTAKCGELFRIFDRIIDHRIETRKDTSSSTTRDDVLQAMLNIMEDQKGDQPEINRPILHHLLMDVLGLGMDSTTRIVEWSMAEILRNPGIHEKCHQELESAIGKGKAVEEGDVGKLPYLQAVLQETLRLHPPAPFLLPRKMEEVDVEIGGYVIPKGARVLFNVWAIGRDPERWPDPEDFVPERFLNLGHDFRGQSCDMIPFGVGRRICPAVTMVIRMVTAVVGSMINCFDWELEGGIQPKNLDMGELLMITLGRAKSLRAIPSVRE